MKKHINKYIIALTVVTFLIACSTKKNTAMTRAYHSTTTKYNILYNGQLAYDEGIETLKTKYHDDFNNILTVERIQPEKNAVIVQQERDPNFERAEEKAVKAAHLHSIYISGKEHNPQMDEAYMLLGKSRYHDNRYVPALEAFNYILLKYPDSDLYYDAQVWKEKTNLRLEYYNVAIKNLKKLLKNDKFKNQTKSEALATLAQGYIYSNHLDSAKVPLKEAIELTNNLDERARYTFILGQLNSKTGDKDAAIANFQKIIDYNHRIPRSYLINAYAGKFSNQDYKTVDTLVFLKEYNKLLKDRENRAYQDVIYNQMGTLYDLYGVSPKAIENYNKSLSKTKDNQYLKVSNYRSLADLYYKQKVYEMAGKYYDSTMVNMNPESRGYLTIKHKRNNLIDVVKFEAIIKENDSILNLVYATPDERNTIINKFIEERKIADAKKEAKEKAANTKAGSSASVLGSGKNSSFYFYSPNAVTTAQQDFKKKWGDRALTDNWRLKSKASSSSSSNSDTDLAQNDSEESNKDKNENLEDMRYNTNFFLSQIPTDPNDIKDMKKDRDNAYYQLGLIYSDRLEEYQLAADRLEKLLTLNPMPELIEPTKYHLYKIYSKLNPAKAELVLNDLKINHPNSQYTKVLLDPNAKLELENSPVQEYERIYALYKNGALYEVLEMLEDRIPKIMNDGIVSKYEYLKATTIGRLNGLEDYKKAMNFVLQTYPNSKEAVEAKRILNVEIPMLMQKSFKNDLSRNIKMIYEVDYPLTEETTELRNKLQRYANDRAHTGIKFSADMYSKNKMFFVLHGVKSGNLAKSAQMYLEISDDYGIKKTPTLISSDDYGVVLIKKNWDEYLKTQLPPAQNNGQ